MERKVIETELPGIGRKYTLKLEKNGRLIVIILNSGRREIYFMSNDESEACSFSLELSEEEAKELGFILAGALYEPIKSEKIDVILKEVVMEWIKVEKNSELADRTISQLQIRKRTGVSIIAIDREGKIIPSPDPYTEKLMEGDKLIAVGTRQQLKSFRETFKIK